MSVICTQGTVLTHTSTLDSAPRVAAGSTTGSARRRKRPTRLVREVAPPSALEATKARVRSSSSPTCTTKSRNANSRSVSRRPPASVDDMSRLTLPSLSAGSLCPDRTDRSGSKDQSTAARSFSLRPQTYMRRVRAREPAASQRQHSYRIAYHPDFSLSLSPRLAPLLSLPFLLRRIVLRARTKV